MTEASSYSDYTVFADESGDHGLDKIDAEFPMFALSFCMIEKAAYVASVVPAFQQFKFDFWGHDGVVLHEHEIRKRKGAFTLLLTNPDLRASFYDRLNGLMEPDAMVRAAERATEEERALAIELVRTMNDVQYIHGAGIGA